MSTVAKHLIIALVFSSTFAKMASAQQTNCSAHRAQYHKLSEPLLFGKNRDDAQRYEGAKKTATDKLMNFVSAVILRKLEKGSNDKEIVSYLTCLQEGEESGSTPDNPRYLSLRSWDPDVTNTPSSVTEHLTSQELNTTAFILNRGGSTLPDTRPVVLCYSKKQGHWTLAGRLGEDFERRTFEIHVLKSPVEGQVWYLLSGRRLGDSGGRLLLEVVTCDGSKLDTKWKRDNFRWGKALVAGSGTLVEISYEKLSPHGPIPLPAPPPTTEVLTVTKKGLE